MATNDPTRQTWNRPIEFLFVVAGQGVGFGNVWRFPYVCYRNGGGVFFIPYIFAIFLLGIPVSFMEGALGQFTSRGVISAFKIVPLFQGIGVMVTIMASFCMAYYSLLFAWVLYYLFSSFSSQLPWSHCKNEWNSQYCSVQSPFRNQSDNFTMGNSSFNGLLMNITANESLFSTDPATEFWERKVLGISPGIDVIGKIKWDLALCLLLVWILIYFCIWRGAQWIGKISYVTATFPYVLIIILLVYGVTLEGATDGIKFYLYPDWSRLAHYQVWLDACIQVFFSYAVGLAIHTSLGSCNHFHHNILKHYWLFAVINSGTSFICGFVIFSALGFMAKSYGTTVDQVAESGPGLAFIAYPQAISQMPIPQLWAVLFFLMLSFIAIDSEFAGTDAVIVSVSDVLPTKFSQTPGREIFTAVLCFIWFLVGLTMVTEGGVYVQQIVEWYTAGKIVFIITFMECVIICWFYGVNRFRDNLECMLGYKIGPFFKYIWLVIAPALCLLLLASDIMLNPDLVYRRRSGLYIFPEWTRYVGWALVICCVIPVPVIMIWKIVQTNGTLVQRLRFLLKPDFTEVQLKRSRLVLETMEKAPENIPLSQESVTNNVASKPLPL